MELPNLHPTFCLTKFCKRIKDCVCVCVCVCVSVYKAEPPKRFAQGHIIVPCHFLYCLPSNPLSVVSKGREITLASKFHYKSFH